jgi:DNA-binding NtrC family response regulator
MCYCLSGLSPILVRVSVLDQHYRELGTCLVIIDRASDLVLECFGELPFPVPDGLKGRDWRDALTIPPDSTAVISQAIAAGVGAALPPVIVGAGADGDFLMTGLLSPQRWCGTNAMQLHLRPLDTPWGLAVEDDIATDDIVAVLGVDRLEFSPTWGVPETEGLMTELRFGLQQILREEDWLGLPEGSTLPVVLRALEPEAALDVSRALSSHLHQVLARSGGGAQYARACIGLSQRLHGQTGLSALVAANAALLQAQSGSDERIRFSSPWDPLGLAARSLNATGAFQDAARNAEHRRYLNQLIALPESPRRLADYAASALLLTVEQPGLTGAVLLQARHNNSLDCIGAVIRNDEHVESVPAEKLPRAVQAELRQWDLAALDAGGASSPDGFVMLPLRSTGQTRGALLLLEEAPGLGFRPGVAALQQIATVLGQAVGASAPELEHAAVPVPQPRKMEKGIEGYVLDNMEGAIDQAVFLAGVDMPVAIVGERGTGKMYVAQVIHTEAGSAADKLVRLDCRSFRNRSEAWSRISAELEQGEGRTLVFKSPHLLHLETQARLARQLASRTSSDEKGSRYLAHNRYVALFPMPLSELVKRGELDERLASVFAGYPILVPPLRERPRAVLRWAHKILEQESSQVDRRVSGFTPDAEQALLQHDWPGNISDMRNLVREALARTDNEWITPVDLGLFVGITADGQAAQSAQKPFLARDPDMPENEMAYAPSSQEELRLALGQALAVSLETDTLRPLGAWLDDEIIEAALDRCGGNSRGAAEYLQTRNRNIGRWLPRVKARENERNISLLWQESRRLVREWVLESAPPELAPQQLAQDMLMSLVLQQCGDLSVTDRARIMGVSTPTYQKRVKQLLEQV